MSERSPASSRRTCAAIADGANPIGSKPCEHHARRAASRARDLPAPAGPTSSATRSPPIDETTHRVFLVLAERRRGKDPFDAIRVDNRDVRIPPRVDAFEDRGFACECRPSREARRTVALGLGHAVSSAERRRHLLGKWRGEAQDLRVDENEVGEIVDALADRCRVDTVDEPRDLLDDLGTRPGRVPLFEADDDLRGDLLRGPFGCPRRTLEKVRGPGLGRESPCLGLGAPMSAQLLSRGVRVDLRGPCPIGGDLEALGALVRRERSSDLRGPARDQLVAERLQLVSACRPVVEEERRDALDLGRTVVVDGGPRDPEPLGQLRSKRRLVEHAGRLLRREQLTAVEREPRAVLRADLVGDEDVGVELWVSGARGAVDEARGEEPFGVDLEDAVVAAARERGVLFDEGERCGDRGLVRGEDLCGCRFVGERPQHRDALRRREREREAGDGALVVGIEAAPER